MARDTGRASHLGLRDGTPAVREALWQPAQAGTGPAHIRRKADQERYDTRMRYAVYFTPPSSHEVVRRAESWLGRSVFGRVVAPAPIGGLSADARAPLVRAPARYGFHATLKAPFKLAEQAREADLIAEVDAFAAGHAPVPALRLEVSRLGGFFALTTAASSPELQALADAVVHRFEPFRAPLTEADIARRNPDALSPRQRAYLTDWGYPFVFEEFRFHMTLSERLSEPEASTVGSALRAHFKEALAAPLPIDRIAVYRETARGAPFTCIHEAALVRDAATHPA